MTSAKHRHLYMDRKTKSEQMQATLAWRSEKTCSRRWPSMSQPCNAMWPNVARPLKTELRMAAGLGASLRETQGPGQGLRGAPVSCGQEHLQIDPRFPTDARWGDQRTHIAPASLPQHGAGPTDRAHASARTSVSLRGTVKPFEDFGQGAVD